MTRRGVIFFKILLLHDACDCVRVCDVYLQLYLDNEQSPPYAASYDSRGVLSSPAVP